MIRRMFGAMLGALAAMVGKVPPVRQEVIPLGGDTPFPVGMGPQVKVGHRGPHNRKRTDFYARRARQRMQKASRRRNRA